MSVFMHIIIDDVILMIEKSLQSELSIGMIAEKVGYSRWHLQREFKKRCGIRISQYIIARRIFKCAMLLAYSNYKATYIGYLYQFDSPQTFSSAFKKCTGLSPKAFRQKNNVDMGRLQPIIRFDSQHKLSYEIKSIAGFSAPPLKDKYYKCNINNIDSAGSHFTYLHDALCYIQSHDVKSSRVVISPPVYRNNDYYMRISVYDISEVTMCKTGVQKYITFPFSGELKELCVFSNLIYNYMFANLSYHRVNMPDLFEASVINKEKSSIYIEGIYMIPII